MKRFTGNPFVDAGIAGMCAAAEVSCPEQLDQQAIEHAVKTLLQVMTSESAFVKKEPYKVFATSTMAAIFPNSPHPQPSYPTPAKKSEKYQERIQEYLSAMQEKDAQAAETCFACGGTASCRVGLDRFPLIGSDKDRLNFHPMLGQGHPICGFCALAVQFLPFSLLQTRAEGGRLWFLHTLEAGLAIAVARDFTFKAMMGQMAAGEPFRFYGDWACPGEEGAIISLLLFLSKEHAEQLAECETPVSALVFSNDNREQSLQQIVIPHVLLRFFEALRYYPEARRRFEQELLRVPKVGTSTAVQMLGQQSLIRSNLLHDQSPPTLRGGWQFHRLYSMEVIRLNRRYIQVIESVGQRIAGDEDAKKWINALRLSDTTEVFGVLLEMVRDGLISRGELQTLVPPGGGRTAIQARDYLLGVIYALQSGESIEPLEERGEEPEEGLHPLIARIEEVGKRLIDEEARPKQLVQSLREARSPDQIRRALLRTVQHGVLRWHDFIFFCPPDEGTVHFQTRDYLLAYLYDCLRGQIEPEEEEQN